MYLREGAWKMHAPKMMSALTIYAKFRIREGLR
jgi:hypothetical protein